MKLPALQNSSKMIQIRVFVVERLML